MTLTNTIARSILSRRDRAVSAVAKALARTYFLLTRGDYWHFAAVYLETSQHCNRRCSYCPQGVAPLPVATITDSDFGIAIERLREIAWNGPVILSRFGEPLLDRQILSRIAKLKAALPRCSVQMFSNGDRLNLQTSHDLIVNGLSLCKITRHSPTPPSWDKRVGGVLTAHPKHFVLLDPVKPYTIGGLNREAEPFKRCTLPSWAFIINPDLTVSLCCHDYHRDVQLGNLRTQTIYEIWRSERFTQIRKELREGVFTHPICAACGGNYEAFDKK